LPDINLLKEGIEAKNILKKYVNEKFIKIRKDLLNCLYKYFNLGISIKTAIENNIFKKVAF
jgi:hypothetical protein